MSLKRKINHIVKSFSVLALIICLLMASIPIASAATTIQSVIIKDVNLVENTCGEFYESYDENTNQNVKWYCYKYTPMFELVLSDGTTVESDTDGSVWYNNRWTYMSYEDDQNYDNQWGVGTHTVSGEIFGITTQFNVTITESPIKEISIENVELIENSDGYYDDYYDDDYNCYEWYRYYYEPEFTVTLNDGTVLESDGGEIYYNDEYYDLEFVDGQSYENQWGVGTHTVTAKLMGAETTFDVNIIESPVKEISIEKVELIKDSDGYYESYYDEYDNYYEWYCYKYAPKFTVTLNDGTVLKSEWSGIYYNDEYYDIKFVDDQSYENQWDVGTHSVTAKILGAETTFNVDVVESPIKEIVAEDIEIIQYTHGYFNEEDIDGENVKYFLYVNIGTDVTVTFKDGTVAKSIDGEIYYKGKSYSIEFFDDQVVNPWSLGTHTATASVLGSETTFNVTITESPYKSFEVLEVEPIAEESDYAFYSAPDFTYKVTKKDGTSFTGTYLSNNMSIDDVDIYVSNRDLFSFDFDKKSWGIGSDNELIVYYAGVSDTVNVEIVSDQYEYIEQNGGIYITSLYNQNDNENVVIPSEIDGKKVLGLVSLGENDYYTSSIKYITLPDSVVSIGQDAFKYCSDLEKINIGSGVTYLDSNMFSNNKKLKEINVSADNKNYFSMEGVVYDANVTTLVAYPIGGSKDYEVPPTVSNIDVLDDYRYSNVNVTFADSSKNYVTVDDVTYTADMKKVVRCNNDKAGAYEMPDSVVDIADNAFANCANLTDVTVSKNVTEIVYGAFVNCTSLSSVKMPSAVKKIGPYSFGNCTSLENIDLPSDLEVIDEGAFKLSGLTSVSIPDKVTEINLSAFSGSEVADVTFGKGLTSIGDKAFVETNITNLNIPDNVTNLGDSVFSSCANLTELTIGKGLTTISEGAFSSTGLTELVVPENITLIGKAAFSNCENLNDLTIKGTGVNIGAYAFAGCPLKNYDFNSNINVIGVRAFSGAEIENLVVSPTVTEITYNSFGGCKNLSSIEIPDTVLKIDGRAFDGTKWYNEQPNGEVYLDQIFYGYKGSMPSKVELKDGTVTIAENAFEDSDITGITLPEGLKGIGRFVFNECKNITEIYIPSTVEYIGECAFTKCSSLTEINVSPDNKYFTSVDGVLYNKDKTELIYCPRQSTDVFTVPETVKRIKTLAFDSSNVSHVIITSPDTVLEDYSVGYSLSQRTLINKILSVHKNNVLISCPADSYAEEYANKMYLEVLLTTPSVSTLIGDATGDNMINIADATLVQMQVAKLNSGSIITSNADVNKDGYISIKDATAIQMYVAKYISSFDEV